jgi:hypothetical protein
MKITATLSITLSWSASWAENCSFLLKSGKTGIMKMMKKKLSQKEIIIRKKTKIRKWTIKMKLNLRPQEKLQTCLMG